MIDVKKLEKLQLDALKESCNIGASHAATAIGKMINKTINLSVPDMLFSQIKDLNTSLARFIGKERAAGVYLELTDNFSGSIVYLFSEKGALALADILMGREAGSGSELGETEKSAIMEVGNIVVSAYANALGQFVNARVLLTPPSFKHDLPDSVIGEITTTVGSETDTALILDIKMEEKEKVFNSYFILLPTPHSMEIILKRLFEKIHE